MCLTVLNIRNLKRQIKKDRFVYKFYKVSTLVFNELKKNPDITKILGFPATSPYQEDQYLLFGNAQVVSNRPSTELRDVEKWKDYHGDIRVDIEQGLHSFLSLDDAIEQATEEHHQNIVIVKMLAKGIHQVALGTFSGHRGAVHTKLTFDSITILHSCYDGIVYDQRKIKK